MLWKLSFMEGRSSVFKDKEYKKVNMLEILRYAIIKKSKTI